MLGAIPRNPIAMTLGRIASKATGDDVMEICRAAECLGDDVIKGARATKGVTAVGAFKIPREMNLIAFTSG